MFVVSKCRGLIIKYQFFQVSEKTLYLKIYFCPGGHRNVSQLQKQMPVSNLNFRIGKTAWLGLRVRELA